MTLRNLPILTTAAVVLWLLPAVASAQSLNAKAAKSATQNWNVPRAPDGHPDLQGVWSNNTATPMERPKELAGRAFLTDQEVAAMKKKAAELYDGNGDAAFGDTIFQTVWASVKGSASGPHKK